MTLPGFNGNFSADTSQLDHRLDATYPLILTTPILWASKCRF